MKIIKPVLLGPKLIAVGPLKCFKGGGGGSSGGGGGGGGGGGKGGGGGGSSSSSGSKGGTPSPAPKKPDTPKPAEPEKKEKEEEKSGFAGFMDTITGGDAAEANRLGMSTEEYKQAKEDAGEGTGLFGRTEGDIRSAAKARKSGEIRDAAPISDEVLKEAEAREKAKKDLEERNKALEQEKLEAERSPFVKQLAGLDVDKAVEAQEQRRIGKETSAYGRLAKEMDLGQEIEDQAMLREAEEDVRMAKEVSPFTKQLAGVDIEEAEQAQSDLSLSKALERQDLQRRKDARDRKQLEEAEDLRVARGAEDLLSQEMDLEKEQSSFGRQLRDEDFNFQKAIEDRALSEDLRREDLRRRKTVQDRLKEEREQKEAEEAEKREDLAAEEIEKSEKLRKQMAADPRFGSEEEFKAFKAAQEEKEQRAAGSKMMADYEDKVRMKQAEMDRRKGLLSKKEYESFTGQEDVGPGVKTRIVDGVKKKVVETAEGTLLDTAGNLIEMIPGVGLVNTLSKAVGGPDLVKKALQKTGVEGAIKSGVSGAVDTVTPSDAEPTSFQEAIEARAAESEEKAAPKPAPKPGGDRSSGAGALAALGAGALAAQALQPKAKEPAAPAPEPAKGEPTDVKGEQQKLVDALKKQASGEESIAEKQIRRTQDRSLAQRLAALKSMRGQDSGSKLRSFSKASDKARREAEGQIEIAGMKERRSAQDQLRAQLNTMSEAEARERWNRINFDERQRLLKMRREDAIKRGEFNKWLTVAAMGQKFFPDQIKGVGDWVGTNVLDPVFEGGKKVLSGVGDFIGDVFSADGGYISGPGTETSDSIPARLSDGEFVVKASAVRGIGKSMGAKGKEKEREKGVDFLYKLQDKMDKAEKFAKGGEAYVRPKKAFREAIGYEAESRFHDKAAKDAKHGGARRKFRHFQQGGPVSLDVKGMKPQFNIPQSQGYGSVVAAQKDLDRRLEELERQLGR